MEVQKAGNSLGEQLLTAAGIAILLINLLVEFLAPGIFTGVGYVFAVILTLYSAGKANSILVAVSATLAIIVSVFFLHPGQDSMIVGSNHAISLFGVVMAMFFVIYVKNLREKAEKDTKQLDSLFLHATEGIIIANRKGEIVLINPCAEQMFGYNKDELTGKGIDILLPGNLREKHAGHRKQFHQKPSNRAMGVGRDLYGQRKDGKVFPVEISLSHYNLNNESFVTAFIIDITVRKKHDEELKQLNSDLEQKISERTTVLRETMTQLEESKEDLASALKKEKELGDLKSRFVSTVSHEFRTPLSTILTSAALAKNYTTTEQAEKRERHLTRIEDAVTHMNAMLEDLLSLGKLEEGLVETKTESFDLSKFLVDFVNEMNEINRKGQKIVLNNKQPLQVVTDKRLLKNILMNLTSNAFKFSPPDSNVELIVTANGGQFNIAVKDTGIGIPLEDQKQLFERFFRAHNASNIQGTGLGLHIVSKYLELLGGAIQLESKENIGTTFTISLPH